MLFWEGQMLRYSQHYSKLWSIFLWEGLHQPEATHNPILATSNSNVLSALNASYFYFFLCVYIFVHECMACLLCIFASWVCACVRVCLYVWSNAIYTMHGLMHILCVTVYRWHARVCAWLRARCIYMYRKLCVHTACTSVHVPVCIKIACICISGRSMNNHSPA